MKKLRVFLIGLFLAIGVVVFAADSKDEASEALQNMFGLSGFWAGAILTLVTVVGKLIPKKGADWMYWIEKIIHYINEHTNRESVVEKAQRVSAERTLLKNGFSKKVLLTLAVVFIGASSVFAQSNFFKPIDQVIQKQNSVRAEDGIAVKEYQWITRPYVYLAATVVDFSGDDPQTASLQGAGFGVSYGKFTEVDGKAYCNFSVNASLLTSIDIGGSTSTKLGGAVTVDVFDKLIGVGVGYIDKKAMLVIPISYSF